MNEKLLWQLLGHLICLVQLNAFILVENAYLGRGKLRWPVLWAELLCVAQIGYTLFWNVPFFTGRSILLNMLFLFVSTLFFGGNWSQKLNACMINGVMCLLTENTVCYICAWFLHAPPGEVWRYVSCLAAMVITIAVVGIAAAYYLRRWRSRRALEPLQALMMSFFPGVVVVLNIVLMTSGRKEEPTLLNMLLTVGLTVAVLVHIGIVQMFNEQVVQWQNSRFRAQLEQQRAEALLDSYTAQRRLTHEFTNHISALSALLEQGDTRGARDYIASVSKTVAAGTTIMDTHNPLLDSILSKKYEEAARRGVTVYFDLCDLKQMPFDSMDMVIVLSNLLDNAIRAAEPALPPEVYVRIRKTPEEFLLSVRNRVQEDLDIAEDGRLPHSTKREAGHGMGLANVQQVLQKYGAEYTVSCRDRWFRFTCSIPARIS